MPLTNKDFYKTDHRRQYPDGSEVVYSNFTPRSDRLFKGLSTFDGKIVWFGIQAWIKEYFIREYIDGFFSQPKELVVGKYKRRLDSALGPGAVPVEHIEALHDLGYLPLKIKALPEGSVVPMKVPVLTIVNTHPEFYWLVNDLETVMSSDLWKPTTVATIAREYRKLLDKYAEKTGSPKELVPIQGHDFSFRGMSGRHDAKMSGMGHLLSFVGTDTIPAIDAVEEFYNGNAEKQMIGCSVPACYDSETEILTEEGFVKFTDLEEGVKVAQYHSHTGIDFVEPSAYYNMPYKGQMVKWSNEGYDTVDLFVTPNHNMVRIKDDKLTHEFFEAGDTNYRNRKGYSHRSYLPVSGLTGVTSEVGMSAEEKLLVAFQADGSFPSRDEYTSGQVRFSLKKERKKERLIQLLSEAHFNYTVSEKDDKGYYNFWVNPGKRFFVKDFSWVTLDKGVKWYNDFIFELSHWDGSLKNNCVVYSNTDLTCVSKVQEVCALSGYKTQYNYYEDKRGDRLPLHTVIVSDKLRISGNSIQREFVDYEGTVHCVSVPTKMLVVRRNGRVAICGNTEHSVMCMGGKETETDTFSRLLDLYPAGIVSIVSDTWNFWDVITKYTVTLKDKILARQPITDPDGNVIVPGKTVFRPDSGDPVKILCGLTEDYDFRRKDGVAYPLEAWKGAAFVGGSDPIPECVVKGAVECLWDAFGGTKTAKGYKVLDEHVGLIYGDSITLQRAEAILKGLEAKGFASCNVVFGIGSYTYQYITRDTFGFAMKATYGEVNGEPRELFKDPITDSGTKKSAKGLLRAEKDENGEFVLYDQQTWEQEAQGELRTIFLDGELLVDEDFETIRARLAGN